MTNADQLASVERQVEDEYRKAKDALAVLRRYLTSNGSHGTAPIVIRRDDAEADFTNQQEDTLTIIDKVNAIMQADPNQKWTVPSMLAHLKKINFPLAAKKPDATLGLVFMKLVRKRKTIVRVKKGAGRIPSVYRAATQPQEGAIESIERAAS